MKFDRLTTVEASKFIQVKAAGRSLIGLGVDSVLLNLSVFGSHGHS